MSTRSSTPTPSGAPRWRPRSSTSTGPGCSTSCPVAPARSSATGSASNRLDWVDGIDVAAIDAFRGYATAIGEVLPDATLVIDHFHAIRLASTAVSDARRRVQQDTLGHRGRTGDPLYGIRRLLLRTWANLNDRGWERLAKASPPATPTVTSPPSGSPASCCQRSTRHTTSPTRSAG